MTYYITNATVDSITGLMIIPDGVSNSITFPLTKAPFNLPFTSTSGFPIRVPIGPTMSFSAPVGYPVTVILDPIEFTITLTFTGDIPPAGNGSYIATLPLIYQG